MNHLEVNVLGPLQVPRAGVAVPIPSGRRRTALAYLVVHVGRPVSANALIEHVWGDDLPAVPGAALHTVVSRLRAALGEQTIRSDPAGYVLDIPRVAVDAQRFEDLHHRAAVSDSAAEARDLLEQGLRLWRGPAYGDLADAAFATVEAQRLDRLRLDAMEALASACLDCGAPSAAAAILESLLTEQPFREHGVELLMTSLHRSGRTTEALERFRAHRARMLDELGLEPAPALRVLEADILGGRPPPTVAGDDAPNVPAWLETSDLFVGRDYELAQLADAVTSGRLVTVTGTGGVGKSRLVAQVLPQLATRLPGHPTVVELAPVRPGGAALAVAEAFGLTGPAAEVRAHLLEHLGATDGLLVLDNCEHLLEEVTALVPVVLRQCPRVRVLATSRRRLGLAGERVVPLLSLPVPDSEQTQLGSEPAVRLLSDRIRRIRPGFQVVTENEAALAAICRQLDGLPLALEIAASRAAALGARRVLAELTDGAFDTGELDAVVAWSLRLLTPTQRRGLLLLSVLPANFDLEAFEGLTVQLPDWPRDAEPSDVLAGLVEASLVIASDVAAEARFGMLAVVRDFAAGRLLDSTDAEVVPVAHARWVRGLVRNAAAEAVGPGCAEAYVRLRRYRGSITSALAWGLRADWLDLAVDIAGNLRLCPHWAPGPDLAELIVAVADRCAAAPQDGQCLALAAGACTLADRGDLDRSRRLAVQAAKLASTPAQRYLTTVALVVGSLYRGELDEAARYCHAMSTGEMPAGYQAEAHISLALIAGQRGASAEARREAAFGLTAADASGSAAVRAFALYAAGEMTVEDDQEHAAELLADAVCAADTAGAAHVALVARLARLGCVVRMEQQQEATALALSLLDTGRRSSSWPQVWTTLRIVAELLTATGQTPEAAFLMSAADGCGSAPPITGADVPRYRSLEEALTSALGSELRERIADLAAATPRAQVVDRATAALHALTS